jgi:excisionase family DNA binding protein
VSARNTPTTTTTLRRWVSLSEAADYAGCSVQTLRRRIADGTLSASRFGPRAIRVDLDELENALRPIPTAAGGRHA